MMSATSIRGRSPAASRVKVSRRSFSSLPTTWSTSGMAAKLAGSIWAAQPVTTMRASGFSRRALRIAWRAWRVASAVTAQVLITTAWLSPAAAAWPRMTSVSKALSRQPKETSSIMG